MHIWNSQWTDISARKWYGPFLQTFNLIKGDYSYDLNKDLHFQMGLNVHETRANSNLRKALCCKTIQSIAFIFLKKGNRFMFSGRNSKIHENTMYMLFIFHAWHISKNVLWQFFQNWIKVTSVLGIFVCSLDTFIRFPIQFCLRKVWRIIEWKMIS